MAYSTVQMVTDSGVTSIFGRRMKLDRFNNIVGVRGVREPVLDLTTVGTTLGYGGTNRITSATTGPVTHNLPAPLIGSRIVICNQSTSTASHQFLSTPNGGAFLISSLGTTGNVLNNIGPGGSITLRAVSTVNWVVDAREDITSTGLARSFTWTTST